MPDDWPFGNLRRAHYRVLYCDPPWKFSAGGKRNPSSHYPTMPLRDIAALPVKDLCHPDGCRLFMWVTMPILLLPFGPREVLQAWGFRYSTARVWAKLWPKEDGMFIYPDSMSRGTGFEVNGNAELLVIAKRGRVEPVLKGRQPPSVFYGVRRQHSRKPDHIRDEIARTFDGPRAELFCRHAHDGWDVFGNEVTKFNASGRAA